MNQSDAGVQVPEEKQKHKEQLELHNPDSTLPLIGASCFFFFRMIQIEVVKQILVQDVKMGHPQPLLGTVSVPVKKVLPVAATGVQDVLD